MAPYQSSSEAFKWESMIENGLTYICIVNRCTACIRCLVGFTWTISKTVFPLLSFNFYLITVPCWMHSAHTVSNNFHLFTLPFSISCFLPLLIKSYRHVHLPCSTKVLNEWLLAPWDDDGESKRTFIQQTDCDKGGAQGSRKVQEEVPSPFWQD